jgi:flagellar biosynthetic protein FliO
MPGLGVKKLLAISLVVLFTGTATFAQESTNTISSVKVSSAGDKAVIVDVYIKGDSTSPQPQMSSRKYQDNKYIIDLINVKDQGATVKDTSGSAGLIKNKDLKIGNVSGSSVSRVLIDLDDPDLQIKKVNYHVLKPGEEAPGAKTEATENPAVKTEKPVATVVQSPSTPAIPSPAKSEPAKEVKKEAPKAELPKVVSKPEVPKPAPKQDPVVKTEPIGKQPDKQGKPVVVTKTDPGPAAIKPETANVQEVQVIHKTSTPTQKEHISVTRPPEKLALANVNKPEIVRVQQKPEAKPVATESKAVQSESKQPDLKNPEKHTNSAQGENKILAQAQPEPVQNNHEPVKTPPADPEQLPINLGDSADPNRRVVNADDSFDLGNMATTFGWALIIVIPLILVVIWVMNIVYQGRDSMGLKGLAGATGNKFKILSSTSLGQGKSVHLVEIKGRQLVIGCTNNSINILTEFNDYDDFVEAARVEEKPGKNELIENYYQRSRPPLGSFAQLYKDYKNKVDDHDLEDEY